MKQSLDKKSKARLRIFYPIVSGTTFGFLVSILYLATGSKYYNPESFIYGSLFIMLFAFLLVVMDDEI